MEEIAKNSNAPGASRRRMLVVEDDPATFIATRTLLHHYGWDVSHAGSVGEALAALDSHPQHVLLDLGLPDGDGAKVLQHIREQKLPIAVTVVTAADPVEASQRVAQYQPTAILRKPLNLLDLLMQLRSPAKR